MGFLKKWKEKRASKKDKEDLKRPSSSYDIYHQNETLTLEADINDNLKVGYEEDSKFDVSDTSLDIDQKKSKSNSTTKKTTTVSTKKDKTSTTTVKSKTSTTTIKSKKGSEDMAEKKGRNIYYVSARKDKNGKKIGWEVKKENADKVTKVCETKEEAIAFVKEKAGNQGSTCIIRKMDGSIEKTMKF